MNVIWTWVCSVQQRRRWSKHILHSWYVSCAELWSITSVCQRLCFESNHNISRSVWEIIHRRYQNTSMSGAYIGQSSSKPPLLCPWGPSMNDGNKTNDLITQRRPSKHSTAQHLLLLSHSDLKGSKTQQTLYFYYLVFLLFKISVFYVNMC